MNWVVLGSIPGRFESWPLQFIHIAEKFNFGPNFSALWKIPHRVEIWRNLNLVRALNPICRSAHGASADRLIGMGARAHRPVCASSLRNGIPEREREREQEPGTGTGTLNGNGKRNTEKIPKRGEICFEFQIFRYFLNAHNNSAPGGVRTWDPRISSQTLYHYTMWPGGRSCTLHMEGQKHLQDEPKTHA